MDALSLERSSPSRRQTYVLVMRLWREETGADAFEWRAFVQDTKSGNASYLRTWEGLAKFMDILEAREK